MAYYVAARYLKASHTELTQNNHIEKKLLHKIYVSENIEAMLLYNGILL